MNTKLKLKVFVSSPGDVAQERALARRVLRRLADRYSKAVELQIIMWEHEPLYAHAGPQVQTQRTSECDLVICILWSRLGTRLPSDFALKPGEIPPTGTEFEIDDALESFGRQGKPRVLIYRRTEEPNIGLFSPNAHERLRQSEALREFLQRRFHDRQGALISAQHLYEKPWEFETALREHVEKWLQGQVGKSVEPPRWEHGSPYRGLRVFETKHSQIYFGRTRAVSAVVNQLDEIERRVDRASTRFLLVRGMSGVGKSSLIQAGVIPALMDGFVEPIGIGYHESLRPTHTAPGLDSMGVFGALASRLMAALPALCESHTLEKFATQLRSAPTEAVARLDGYLAEAARRQDMQPKQFRLLIYVDQLEECWSALGESDCTGFGACLLALAREGRIWIIATLRSDFIGRLEQTLPFISLLKEGSSYVLMAPQREEMRDMIREPAEQASLEWESVDDVSLDSEILREASENPESLPLLEYALDQLYERREGQKLTYAAYDALGRLSGGVSASAEAALAEQGEQAYRVLPFVFRALVRVDLAGHATRRYTKLDEFPEGSAERVLVNLLIQRRLCVSGEQAKRPVVFLAHEALLKNWPRLTQWLKVERGLLQDRDAVEHDAKLWDDHERSSDYLATTADKLATHNRVRNAKMTLSTVDNDFVENSRRRAVRNRVIWNTIITGICVLAVVSAIASVISLQQRDLARSEAASVSGTLNFVVSWFQMSDPRTARGQAFTARQMLDRAAGLIGPEKTAGGVSNDPRVLGDLRTALGDAYTALGLYERAEPLLALARQDQNRKPVPAESQVRTLVASGSTFYLAGQYVEAEPLLRDAVTIARRNLDLTSVLRSRALTGLADVLVKSENFPEAERLAQEALSGDSVKRPPDDAELSSANNTLGSVYYYSGDFAAAEVPMRTTLTSRREIYGPEDWRTGESMNNLASVLFARGKYVEAAGLWEQARPIYVTVYGGEHPEVATLLNNLGRSALMAGDVVAARPLLQTSLDMTEKFEGKSHDDLVAPLNSLAMIDAFTGDGARARSEIQRALEIASVPDQDELLDQVLLNVIDIDLQLGDLDHADDMLQRAEEQMKKLHPRDNHDNTWRYAVLDAVRAELLRVKGDESGANKLFKTATPIIEQRFGADGFYTKLIQRRAAAIGGARGEPSPQAPMPITPTHR